MGTRQATVKIGTLTLRESQTFRRGYETASWYTDIEVQPGDYDLYAAFRYNENPNHPEGYVVGADIDVNDAYATMPGLVSGSYFISRLMGQYGEPHKDKDVGNPAEYHLHLYGYALASILVEKGGEFMQGKAKVAIDPAFEVRPTYVGHIDRWNEEAARYDKDVPYQAYGIFHAAPNKDEIGAEAASL
jgi:hypothetical protein